MTGVVSRDSVTALGLAVVAAAVLLAAVSVPDHDRATDASASASDGPCSFIFDLDAQESRLVWFFGATEVPGALVEASSGAANYCQSGFDLRDGERDYDLAVTLVFNEGEGEARQEAVWWLFYPEWDDPTRWGERLFHDSGAEPVYHDGYIVAVSPDASEEIRAAANAAPDTDAWEVWFEGSASLR